MKSHDRDKKGRFRAGNPGGPGNPYARRTSDLRQTLLGAVTQDDLLQIVDALVSKAKQGDITAAKELLDRLLGKATNSLTAAVTCEPPDLDRMSRFGPLTPAQQARLAALDDLLVLPPSFQLTAEPQLD